MGFITAAYRKYLAPIGIVDVVTAIVYGLVALVLLVVLGMWWLFPALLGVLICGWAVRAWVKAHPFRRA